MFSTDEATRKLLYDPWDFGWDSRGNRVLRFKRYRTKATGEWWLAVNGPFEACEQIAWAVAPHGWRPRERDSISIPEGRWWSCLFAGPAPLSAEILATTGLLQEVLSLCTPSGLPFAIALDFYKEDDGYGRLRYTDVGRDVAVLKGYVGSTAESWKAAGTRVSDRMAEVIEGHALMSAPDFIVPVPSSRSGVSEKLGVAVAGRIGAPLLGGVEDTSGAGPAKDNPRVPRTYDVPHDLTGARVVIIDDLVSTGSTLRDLTQALGSRGAVEISSLACVRIMRNV